MRAYGVLAGVLEGSDSETAALLRRAVGAIRLSERADEVSATGLHTRAH